MVRVQTQGQGYGYGQGYGSGYEFFGLLTSVLDYTVNSTLFILNENLTIIDYDMDISSTNEKVRYPSSPSSSCG